jgi:hypothetical protein
MRTLANTVVFACGSSPPAPTGNVARSEVIVAAPGTCDSTTWTGVAGNHDRVVYEDRGVTKTAKDGQAGYLDTTGKPTRGPANDKRPLIPPRSTDD